MDYDTKARRPSEVLTVKKFVNCKIVLFFKSHCGLNIFSILIFQDWAAVDRCHVHLLQCSPLSWGTGLAQYFLLLCVPPTVTGWFGHILSWLGQPSTVDREQHDPQPAVGRTQHPVQTPDNMEVLTYDIWMNLFFFFVRVNRQICASGIFFFSSSSPIFFYFYRFIL